MVPNSSSVCFDFKTHATDFVPDARAADTLRGLIHQQDEQLKGLDDEIAQLKVRIHSLEEQKAELAKFRDLYQAFLAPIRKLPPEILGKVFIQCLLVSQNPGDNHVTPPCQYSYDARHHLVQVCQRWRRTAIGTPVLWTIVQLDLTPWGPYDRVQICLENSGCLPLEVQLDYREVGPPSEIPLLLDNFHRVREIKGYCFRLVEGILGRELILQTPLLRVVHLACFQTWSEEERYRLKDIVQAPLIESLELTECPGLFSVFCRNPGKLQNLKVEGKEDFDLYTPALLDILPFSSSLQVLDIHLPREMTAIREDVGLITLPHLRSLSIKGQLNNICRLLAVIVVPSLDRLTLDSHDHITWIPIQSFLQGDPPPLRYLTLKNITLGHGFVDFVSRLSHLEYLRLDQCRGITAEDLGAFILDSHILHDNMVCPRLATLSFNETQLPGEVFVQVVQSRAPLSAIPSGNRWLRSVEVSSFWALGLEDHYGALEDIRQACGSCLTLHLHPPSIAWYDDDE